MKVRVFAALLPIVSGLFGCHKGVENSKNLNLTSNGVVPPDVVAHAPSPGSSHVAGSAKDSSSNYIITNRVGKMGSIEHRRLTQEALYKKQSQLAGSRVSRVAVSPSFGVTVYQVNPSENNNRVLILPHVLVRFHERSNTSSPEITGVFAMVDGMSPNIVGDSAVSKIPEELLIRDLQGLREAIRREIGHFPEIATVGRCPDKIWITGQGLQELEVEPVFQSENCPLNTALPFRVQRDREAISKINENLLNGLPVQVQSKLALIPPILTQEAAIQIRTAAVFAEYERLVPNSRVVSGSELVAIHEKFIGQLESDLKISFRKLIYSKILQQITEIFFERVPGLSGEMRMKSESEFEQNSPKNISDILKQEIYIGNSVEHTSSLALMNTDPNPQQVFVRADVIDPLVPPTEGRANHLLRTVKKGDLLQFKIHEIRVSEIELEKPKEEVVPLQYCMNPYSQCYLGAWNCTNQNQDDFDCTNLCSGGWENRCTSSERSCIRDHLECECYHCDASLVQFLEPKMCRRECDEWADRCVSHERVCREWTRSCNRRSVCGSLPQPPVPNYPIKVGNGSALPTHPDFSFQCFVLIGNQCDERDAIAGWSKYIVYSIPILRPEWRQVPKSTSLTHKIVEGLRVRFSSGVECKLSDLKIKVVGDDQIGILFENTDTCRPFHEGITDEALSIDFINGVFFPDSFRCGRLNESDSGSRWYSCDLPNQEHVVIESTKLKDEEIEKAGGLVGIWKTFYPRVEIRGEFWFLGQSLDEVRGDL